MAIVINRNVTSGELPLQIPDGAVTTSKIADGAVTDAKIDWSTVGFYNYSTTETQIGTWIDGSPLYRKTVNFGALPDTAAKQVAHNISNLGRVVLMEGYAFRSSDSLMLPIPFASTNGVEYNIMATTTPTAVEITTGLDRSATTECYITLYYTKTSA